MARRKSRKGSEAQTAPTQQQSATYRPQNVPEPDAPPQSRACGTPAAQEPQEQTRRAPGMVHVSVCIMGILAALVLGLYLGSLLPGLYSSRLTSGQAPPSGRIPQAAAPAAQAMGQQPPSASAPSGQDAAQESLPPMPPELAAKIADLEKAVLNNPKDAARWTALGNLYFDTGQARKAASAYERSLSIAPDNPDVLTDLGIMYRETGAYEKAVASFRKASALKPGHENALFNEGVVLYYDLHRKEEAVHAWQRLLEVNPAARAPDGKLVSELIKHLH